MNEHLISLLKKIKYPGFSRNIVSFGIVREATLKEQKASISLELSLSDPTVPNLLKKEIEQVLKNSNAVESVEVKIVVQKTQSKNDSGLSGSNESKQYDKIKKIVAIASGKGGVGKSTITVNLGCSLSNLSWENGRQLKIGLMDCDVYGPSLPLLMGATEKPRVIRENLLEPVESFGVKVMSMGLLVDEETPVVWRGPMVMKTIQQFAENVEWGELDLLLIDLPPGTGDAQLSLAQILPLDGSIIVTTPQRAAVEVARRGARMFEKVNVPLLGVVENMSFLLNENTKEKSFLFGKGGGPTTAQALSTSFLGEIPLHEEVRMGGDHGIPVVISNPECNASIAFESISKHLMDLIGLD